MQSNTIGEDINICGAELTLQAVDPQAPAEKSHHHSWLDEDSRREAAPYDRIHGALGETSTPLWAVLFSSAALIVVLMLFFADSDAGPVVQAVLGSVVAALTAMLLLLRFLDDPFPDGFGDLRVVMESTIEIVRPELQVAGLDEALPCDAEGNPL